MRAPHVFLSRHTGSWAVWSSSNPTAFTCDQAAEIKPCNNHVGIINHPLVITIDSWDVHHSQMGGLLWLYHVMPTLLWWVNSLDLVWFLAVTFWEFYISIFPIFNGKIHYKWISMATFNSYVTNYQGGNVLDWLPFFFLGEPSVQPMVSQGPRAPSWQADPPSHNRRKAVRVRIIPSGHLLHSDGTITIYSGFTYENSDFP